MNRLLMICCSKGRPHRIPEMINSYETTKQGNTDIIFCLNPYDDKLKDYDSILNGRVVIHRNPNYYTPTANEVALSLSPGYDYYGLVDDDYIFRTAGWDVELTKTVNEKGNGWGIAYCNDLWPDSSVLFRHPSVPIVSAKIIKTIGYMILPTLNHFKIDTFMRDLTEPLSLLFFREDIVIEHMHLHNGKAPTDASYQWSYCPEEWHHGEKHYKYWVNMQKDNDHKKIIAAMNKEGIEVIKKDIINNE